MQYLEPAHIEVIAPVVGGVVVDVESLVQILVKAFSIVADVPSSRSYLLKPRIIVGICGMSLVEKRALISAMYLAGAGAVELKNAIEVRKNIDTLVVDIGYGKTQVGLCGEDGLIYEKIGKFGGKDIDSALQFYTKMRYGVAIGQKAAERLKQAFCAKEDVESAMVQGKNLGTGLPEAINVKRSEIAEALNLEMAKLARLIRQAIDESPEGFADKISQKGVALSGGGANLVGLDKFLENELKVPIRIVDNPSYDLIYSLYT
jgi:rod shape-determining protein MreB